MKDIDSTNKSFEDIKHIDENGIEFLYARELQLVLNYKEWWKFENVINKAKESCKNSDISVIDCFVDVDKSIISGKGRKSIIKLIFLSFYYKIHMKGVKIMKNEEISLKNTKAEILDALNAALEREKNMAKVKYEPEKEEKAKKVEKAIETSKENVDKKIFSEELNNKFKDLELAIEAEEEKLKNLYGIEKELNNLVVVINAGKDYMNDLEYSKKEKTEELNNNIKELEKVYQTKKDELNQEYEQYAKKLKIERDRELEEYNYKTKREREISNNKWEDEKKKEKLI